MMFRFMKDDIPTDNSRITLKLGEPEDAPEGHHITGKQYGRYNGEHDTGGNAGESSQVMSLSLFTKAEAAETNKNDLNENVAVHCSSIKGKNGQFKWCIAKQQAECEKLELDGQLQWQQIEPIHCESNRRSKQSLQAFWIESIEECSHTKWKQCQSEAQEHNSLDKTRFWFTF